MVDTKRHVHGEAFMLMHYACAVCGHRETIWNSRDGVTPFGCSCPSCGGAMNHVDWQHDVYSPNYQLRKMQKFWRDGTPDEAEAIMRRRIETMRKSHPCSPVKEQELIKMARDGGDDGEFRKGWPVLSVY